MLSSVMAIVLFSFPHKAPTEEIRQNQTPAPMEPTVKRAEYLKMYTEINENSANQIKQSHRIQRNLDDIDLVLKNVAEKYNQMEGQLKTLYSTVSECGPENCGNFAELLSSKSIKKCDKIKSLKGLKKQIKKYLTRMLCEAQIFSKWFQQLKDSEKHSTFNQKDKEARERLLKTFKISFKTLINEINVTDLARKDRCKSNPRIISSLLNEWRVLQLSRNCVNGYMEQIKEMRQCSEEIRA